MFELIEMNTGKSVTFNRSMPVETFVIPPHVSHEFGVDSIAVLHIESAIRAGRPAAWYSGIYVRRVES